MKPTEVGQLIDESAQRDAIHIAVAPVIAYERLEPGEHVGFCDGSTKEVCSSGDAKPIGIVDPFLKKAVNAGQRFWLFLYPQTITSLRHNWTHPAFRDNDEESKLQLALLATRFGCSFEALMERLDIYAKGSCGDDDSIQEGLNSLEDEIAVRALWANYERFRGVKVAEVIKGNTYFRCVC